MILTRIAVPSDQKENKSRVQPLLFYRKVRLSLIIRISMLAMHSRFIGCLPFEKSVKN
jgi:hypothetical protein